ncbi:MAG: hypothetical protein JWO38_2543 [Gemmataceae bacterium]|nr:hypothetical protein [Gemmataceae bacterium]
MTFRRLFVGATVVFGLSVWSWCRTEGPSATAASADPVYSADTSTEDAGGNHDDAAYRYRTNQPRHWRHIMIGNH